MSWSRDRAAALMLLSVDATGCAAEPQGLPPLLRESAPSPSASAAGPVAHATSAPAASASAAPQAISAELASAPVWVYRQLDTGALPARSTLVTRRLQSLESQAVLTVLTQSVENKSARGLMPVSLEPFGPPTVQRFVGSVTSRGALTTFDLADGTERVKLECEMGTVQVAAATAVRRPEGRGGCNGDRGQWLPRTTKRVEALRCGIDRTPDPELKPDRLEQMAFVAAPGVEFLFVNDDCVMQGGGYRFVPEDASVQAVRAPSAR